MNKNNEIQIAFTSVAAAVAMSYWQGKAAAFCLLFTLFALWNIQKVR